VTTDKTLFRCVEDYEKEVKDEGAMTFKTTTEPFFYALYGNTAITNRGFSISADCKYTKCRNNVND
jgi:hypothetical protein